MATKDTIEIDVNVGEGVKTLGQLKQEFKDVKKELDALVPGTDKYIAKLKDFNEAKGSVEDLNTEIAALNDGVSKTSAVSGLVSGIASGFQAATGAAALLGVESEDVQKALLKVQAVSSFAEGIKGITEFQKGFSDLTKLGKSLVTQILGVETVTKIAAVAQRVWNAVMAANPIMLVVVAIAALVGGVALLVSAFENSKDATEEYIEANNKAIEQSKETVKSIDNEILSLSGLAANEKEIIALKRQRIVETKKQAELDALNAQAQGIKDKELSWYQKILATYLELNGAKYATQVLESDNAKASNELLKEKVDLVKKSAAELQAFDNEQTQKAIDKDKAAAAAAKQAAEKKKQDTAKYLDELNKLEWDAWQAKNKAEQDAADAAAQKEIDDFEYNLKLKEDIEEDARLRKVAKKNREDEKRKQDEEADNEKAQQAAEKSVEALQGISDAFFAHKLKSAKGNEAETLKIQKKAFEVNKAFSVARAIQDGILSVSGALANTGTLGPGAIALAAVNGVIAAANVAKILASTFDGGSASNSSSVNVSTPGTFTQAPNVGSGGGNNQTQLNADGTVNKQGQPSVIKAYVVESESAEVSKRVNKLSEQSKI
jgi:hypothetical protein